MTLTIRPSQLEDAPGLSRVAAETELFPPHLLPDMLGAACAGEAEALWFTGQTEGTAVGLCFAEPEQMADRVWNMRALGVAGAQQRSGVGRRLVAALEHNLRLRGQRLLIVDTSGTDAFAPARAFYAALGYVEEARLRDFWAEGDKKVTFCKPLMTQD